MDLWMVFFVGSIVAILGIVGVLEYNRLNDGSARSKIVYDGPRSGCSKVSWSRIRHGLKKMLRPKKPRHHVHRRANGQKKVQQLGLPSYGLSKAKCCK